MMTIFNRTENANLPLIYDPDIILSENNMETFISYFFKYILLFIYLFILVWTIFKVFIEFVTILLLFYVFVFLAMRLVGS